MEDVSPRTDPGSSPSRKATSPKRPVHPEMVCPRRTSSSTERQPIRSTCSRRSRKPRDACGYRKNREEPFFSGGPPPPPRPRREGESPRILPRHERALPRTKSPPPPEIFVHGNHSPVHKGEFFRCGFFRLVRVHPSAVLFLFASAMARLTPPWSLSTVGASSENGSASTSSFFGGAAGTRSMIAASERITTVFAEYAAADGEKQLGVSRDHVAETPNEDVAQNVTWAARSPSRPSFPCGTGDRRGLLRGLWVFGSRVRVKCVSLRSLVLSRASRTAGPSALPARWIASAISK